MMRLLSLPLSLILLIAAAVADEDGPHRLPVAVRKMGLDDGEKIFPHYISFDRSPPSLSEALAEGRRSLAARAFFNDREALLLAANSSAQLPFRPAYGAHGPPGAPDEQTQAAAGWVLFRRAAEALARLQGRQWGCPSGTSSCVGIGYPYSCCHTGETCYRITDTGLGPVGCCAAGATCGGTISTCGSGDLSCPSNLGGGCCIQGYVCQGVGCVLSSTVVVPGPSTFTTTSTTVFPAPTPSTVVVTVIVTQSQGGGAPVTSTTTQTTTTGPGATTTTTSSGGVAPVKPTLTQGTTDLSPSYCPTGYYACLASAGGGCCQTGRDCATTSCPPPPASTTVVQSDGKTVVVPVQGGGGGAATKTCAGGWFLCDASAGPVPGCCPSGYQCGTASCSIAGPSGTGTVQKVFPSAGAAAAARGGPLYGTGVWGVLRMVAVPCLVLVGLF